jgi:hypothetical protein
LGLETGGVRHFSVRIDGWPNISPDSQIIALFRSDTDDWKNLVGWVAVGSGEIVRAYPPISGPATVLLALVVACWLPIVSTLGLRGALAQPEAAGVAIGTAAVCAVAVSAVCRFNRTKEANDALARVRNALAA